MGDGRSGVSRGCPPVGRPTALDHRFVILRASGAGAILVLGADPVLVLVRSMGWQI